MKKTKLLAPILISSSLVASLAPAIMLTSCNKIDNISLDNNAEQETSANITVATYSFNVTNYTDLEDEIVPEIVDADTQDNVSITLVNYEFKDGKFYVTVSISKTDGQLNDGEEISFSINFKCTTIETQVSKWTKKIEKLKVVHHIKEGETAHIVDTNTEKNQVITKYQKGKIAFRFDINENEEWATGNEAYDINKLVVKTYKHFDIRSLTSRIDLNGETTVSLKEDTAGIKYIEVSVEYNSTKSFVDDSVSFGLYFAYNQDGGEGETKFKQNIDGFKICFNAEQEEKHIELFTSKNRRYYKNWSGDETWSFNYIAFVITDGATYAPTDFSVSASKDTRVKIDNEHGSVYTIQDKQVICIPYTIEEASNGAKSDKDLQNIDITVKYIVQSEEKWQQTIKGFTFEDCSKQGTLINCDATKIFDLKLSISHENTLTNIFTTPIDLSKASVNAYAIVGDNTYAATSATIGKGTSTIVLPALSNETATGERQTVTYCILVTTAQSCYFYTLIFTNLIEA